MTNISAARVARVFVEFADTLTDEFDLIEFLQLLSARIAELLDDSSVGLLFADRHGQLQLMGASGESLKILELFRARQDAGPCMDAFLTALPVCHTDLTTAAGRWPAFAPLAVTAGFRSVHAFPLRLRQGVIGVLNVFTPIVGGNLSQADIEVVQALADVAAIGLLQERAIRRGEILNEQLQGALNSRVVIEQAKGILAHARGISPTEAFDLIRSYARARRHRLSDVAHAVVGDLSDIPELADM
jgi:GAF domain-containing protein